MSARVFALIFIFSTISCEGTVISGSVSGTQSASGTRDPLGLFGTPYGVHYGDLMTISYSYNSADFGASPTHCGIPTCNIYNLDTPSSSTFLSIKINGITQTYAPKYSGSAGVELIDQSSSYPFNEFEETGRDGLGRGADIVFQSDAAVLFGNSLDGLNDTNLVDTIYLTIDGGSELFYLTPTGVSITPEPDSLLLAITGALGLLLYSMWKRFSVQSAR